MATYNIHGLSRSIPEAIKRKIRQDSGFGCVICGCAIFEYEHIEPEFYNAKDHDPNKMTLLCPTCHGKVTKGIWSKDKIWIAKKNPITLKNGFTNEWFDIGSEIPYIKIGGNIYENCHTILEVKGRSIIRTSRASDKGEPFLISGVFCDDEGNETLEILDNEWRAYSSNWDIDINGPLIKIKKSNGKIVLQIRAIPPKGISVEIIDMIIDGIPIIAVKNNLSIAGSHFSGSSFKNGNCAICLG